MVRRNILQPLLLCLDQGLARELDDSEWKRPYFLDFD
jgi:hypothetical protein